MKATVLEEFGGPEKLVYTDYPDPRVGDDEILVRVEACGVNHIDIWIRTGTYKVPLPHVIGTDVAGEVSAVGRRVENVNVGHKVVLAPNIACGTCKYCLRGFDSACERLTLLGNQVDGGYAEYVKAPSRNAFLMPKNLTFEQAASIPVNFATSWHMLVTRANIRPGMNVLVIGAGSGVGVAAIQIAKLAGAHVLTTVGADWKREKAKELGADHVINRKTDDVAAEAKRFTDGKGVDIVFEHVGTEIWDKCVKSLAPTGVLVTCGATSGTLGQIDIRYLYRNQLSIVGSYSWNKSEFAEVLKLFEAGKLRPVIDSVIGLEKAAEAHRRMESSMHFGKIILTA